MIERLSLLSTWPRDLSHGTGIAMALTNLARALEDRGVEVRYAMGSIDTNTPMGIERTRRQLHTSHRPLREPLSPVSLAVDVDGHHIPGRTAGGETVKLVHVRTNAIEMETLCPEYDAENIRLRADALRRNLATADALVTSSRHTLYYLRDRVPDLPPVQAVIPNAIDAGLAEAVWRCEAPRDEVPLVLGYGKAMWRKDFHTAVKASTLLAERGVEHRFELLTYGTLLAELRALVAESGASHISIRSTTDDRGRLATLLNRAWVVCHPAVQEDFGNVYLEAAAAGVPVMAARTGITEEHAIEPKAGLLAAPGDVEEFAAGLESLIGLQGSGYFPPVIHTTYSGRTWADAADELVALIDRLGVG